jgi:hypothetical protein
MDWAYIIIAVVILILFVITFGVLKTLLEKNKTLEVSCVYKTYDDLKKTVALDWKQAL